MHLAQAIGYMPFGATFDRAKTGWPWSRAVDPLAALVGGLRHLVEMIWSHATSMWAIAVAWARSVGVVAEMIPLEANRSLTDKEVVGEDNVLAVPEVTIAFPIVSGGPKPAGLSLIDFGPKTFFGTGVIPSGELGHAHIIASKFTSPDMPES